MMVSKPAFFQGNFDGGGLKDVALMKPLQPFLDDLSPREPSNDT